MRIYLARQVLPVSAPPVEDGAVAVEQGRVTAVGHRGELLRSAGADVEIRDLGDAVILPGLVNAHTHLELSWMAADPPPAGDYTGWLRGLLERRAAEDEGAVRPAAERAIEQVVSRGTVAVGDIGNGTWIAPLLARSPLHGVSFHEIYGFRTQNAGRLLEAAAGKLETIAADPDVRAAGDRLKVVLTPHAPHTTSAALLRALCRRADAAGEPLSIHVAESEAEIALMQHGTGPLPELYRERNVWDDAWAPPGYSPVEHLNRVGALSARTIAVHCVHVGHQDHSMLQARGCTVVTCPRSNS